MTDALFEASSKTVEEDNYSSGSKRQTLVKTTGKTRVMSVVGPKLYVKLLSIDEPNACVSNRLRRLVSEKLFM